MDSRPSIAMIAALAVLVGMNLRPIMASIGPVLGIIQNDLALTSTQASLLTTLPVMMMGAFGLAGPWVQRWIGENTGVAIGLLLIAVANGLRAWADQPSTLIATAALGGTGIAIVQALMPAYLKRVYPQRAGTLMGLYTTGIMAGAAVASAVAAPGTVTLGWRLMLSSAAIPALAALAICVLCVSRNKAPSDPKGLPINSSRAWLLMGFFGIGTGAYTLVLAWLAPYYVELGWSAASAGYLLGALTLTEVMAGLAVSSVIHQFSDRRVPLAIAILLAMVGLGCLVTAPLELAIVATVLLGLGIGALFPLSLIVTLDHTHSPGEAGSLMAFVQGGGYLIAAVTPYFAGILRDEVSSLRFAWASMAVGVAVLFVLGRRFSPERSALSS